MRIHCTSVEESKHIEEISEKVQKLFPKYKVVVIPNRYIDEEVRKKVLAYSKKYHEENKERDTKIRKTRRHLERIEKSKKDGLIDDGKKFNVLINSLSNDVQNYLNKRNSNRNEIFLSNASKSISFYTNDTNVHVKLLNDINKSINEFKFDNLSEEDVLRETAKVVLSSLRSIKRKLEKEKERKENVYDR